jgi:predicted 2-oxoglutarate/Fe(II)-dependent dioxygenase YbiX
VSERLHDEWCDYVFSPEHVACYLHREGGFASRCAPLCERLVAAMTAAYAGMPAPTQPLHIRCVELHAYSVGGALVTPGHRDNGSKRTLIVQLSEAGAFDGGRFVTWNEGAAVPHEMAAGDGLLIDSERMHNVQPVTRGLRHSLVIELWVQPTNRMNRFG